MVEFEENLTIEGSISWVSTNVMNSSNLVIRKGDSLKLVAIPEEGLYGESVTYIINAQSFEIEDASIGTVVEFLTEGKHTVEAILSNGKTGSFVVDVKQADFSDTVTDLASNAEGVLDLKYSEVNSDLFFEGGDHLKVADQFELNASEFRLNIQPLGQGTNQIAARLYENGPIVGTVPFNIIRVNDGLENRNTRSFLLTNFPNRRMVITTITASDIPEGGYVEVNIFRAGVTFLDGTTKLRLSAEDFKNGSYDLQFLFNKNLTGGFCHYISIYDRNGKRLSIR